VFIFIGLEKAMLTACLKYDLQQAIQIYFILLFLGERESRPLSVKEKLGVWCRQI